MRWRWPTTHTLVSVCQKTGQITVISIFRVWCHSPVSLLTHYTSICHVERKVCRERMLEIDLKISYIITYIYISFSSVLRGCLHSGHLEHVIFYEWEWLRGGVNMCMWWSSKKCRWWKRWHLFDFHFNLDIFRCQNYAQKNPNISYIFATSFLPPSPPHTHLTHPLWPACYITQNN